MNKFFKIALSFTLALSAPLAVHAQQSDETEEALILAIEGISRQLAAVELGVSRLTAEKNMNELERQEIVTKLNELNKAFEHVRLEVNKHLLPLRVTALRNPFFVAVGSVHNMHRLQYAIETIAEKDLALIKELKTIEADLDKRNLELVEKEKELKQIEEELAEQKAQLKKLKAKEENELEKWRISAKDSQTFAAKKPILEGDSLKKHQGTLPIPTKQVATPVCAGANGDCTSVRLSVDEGEAAISVAAGSVVYAGWFRGYGNVIIVNHGGGFHSVYGNLKRALKQVGAQLNQGEVLGTIGLGGIYFELRLNGEPQNLSTWFKNIQKNTVAETPDSLGTP